MGLSLPQTPGITKVSTLFLGYLMTLLLGPLPVPQAG